MRHMMCIGLFLLAIRPAFAQAPAAQDSTLDHLVHAAGYVAAQPGVLGAVVEKGSGPVDMVLISGFGIGASVFEGLMARNASRYRMVAVTLPGFEGSAAPPMPPAGTSYGAQTWTDQAVEAVASLIREKGLDRPVLVGHFINGTQVATRVALEQPELVRAVVLLAGTPRYEPVTAAQGWPRGLTLEQKARFVDQGLAPRWFKTVTRGTWVTGNFKASDYSTDPVRGRMVADRANEPPLPVLIRWLCEFHASDLASALDSLDAPLLLIRPGFTEALRADSTRSYLAGYFEEPWKGVLDDRPRMHVVTLDEAGILVMDDQAGAVDRAIAGFLEREVR